MRAHTTVSLAYCHPVVVAQLPIGISFSAAMVKMFVSIAFVGHLGTDYLAGKRGAGFGWGVRAASAAG